MKENSVPDVRCPGCGSASFAADPNGNLICEYCHATYIPPGRECPACGAPYEPGTRRCPSCGAELVRECSACGAINPLLARECLVCGQGLDVLDAIFARMSRTTGDQLRRVREEASGVKAQEEAASQSRLAGMWADEEHRRKALAQARAERERQERIAVAVAVAVVILVIVVAIITLVILSGGAPGLPSR